MSEAPAQCCIKVKPCPSVRPAPVSAGRFAVFTQGYFGGNNWFSLPCFCPGGRGSAPRFAGAPRAAPAGAGTRCRGLSAPCAARGHGGGPGSVPCSWEGARAGLPRAWLPAVPASNFVESFLPSGRCGRCCFHRQWIVRLAFFLFFFDFLKFFSLPYYPYYHRLFRWLRFLASLAGGRSESRAAGRGWGMIPRALAC